MILALLVLLVLLPSANYQVFNGLPLSSAPEAVALALLLPLCVSRALRRLYGRRIRRWGPTAGRGLLWGGVLALAAKLVLLASGTSAGFLACYRSPLTPPPAGLCERSYENPVFRFSTTRIDSVIDFGPAEWNLSFFNSLRFNFLPGVEGNRRRDRLPLQATWHGVLDSPRPRVVGISLVGAATISLNGMPVLELPAHYAALRTVPLTLPPGRQDVEITYTFDDGSRLGQGRPTAPYATLRVLRAPPGDAGAAPLVPAKPPGAGRALAGAADVLVIALGLTLIPFYASLLRGDWWALALLVLAGPAAHAVRPPWPWLPQGPGVLLVVWLLFGLLLVHNRPRRLVLAYLGLLYVAAFVTLPTYRGLGTVTYRPAGDDWLTYESLARTILETWSLEGGEQIFYVQPLFRYVRFGEHLLLGDGDPLILTAALTCLNWGCFWVVARLWRHRPATPGRAVLFVVSGGLLLALANAPIVVRMVEASLSEHVTWLFLPFLFAMLYGGRSPRDWILGSALLAGSLITRPNQAPALVAMLLAFLGPAYRARPRAALAATAVFVLVALLPMAHNLYYGGGLVPFTMTATHPATLVLPPAKLATLADDPATRELAWRQVRGVIFQTRAGGPFLRVVLRGLQAAWVIALVGAWAAGRRLTVGTKLLLLVPFLYLAVHLVYDVWNYYPRHILAAHFAMGLLAMYAATQASRQTDGRPFDLAARPSR